MSFIRRAADWKVREGAADLRAEGRARARKAVEEEEAKRREAIAAAVWIFGEDVKRAICVAKRRARKVRE